MEALQRIGRCVFGLDRRQAPLYRIGSALAAAARLVGLQCFEVAADRSTLISTLGQCGLVFATHRCALACGLGHGRAAYFAVAADFHFATGDGDRNRIEVRPNRSDGSPERRASSPTVSNREGAKRVSRHGVPMTNDEPIHRALGLSDDEAAAVERILGRSPNHLELAMFAVMWSEHCSYKSSRLHLRRLPTDGPAVLVGPGENAGVVDVGDGVAVAFRIESHNHPSAIEPYQGAATGIGGILRDVFTMGARPVALMDPLRFGPLSDARSRWIAEGVVSGISGYGNSVGVPTVGGEIVFDETYQDNPLVNVFCLGLMPVKRLVLGRASGVGNLAVLVGSMTGRDGIGGVSVLASAGLQRRRGRRRQATQRAGGRPVRGEAPHRGVPGPAGRRPRRRDPGPGRCRPHLRHQRDRQPGRRGDGRLRLRGAPTRDGDGAVRGHDQREPGAHAGHRRAPAPGRGAVDL